MTFARVPGPIGLAPVGRVAARAVRGAQRAVAPLERNEHAARLAQNGGAAPAQAEVTYDQFKQAVLAQQIQNAHARGRDYYPPVPEAELGPVEGGHRLRQEAATSCQALLAAVRASLAAAKSAGDATAERVSAIGIVSSYRDYQHDAALWERYYPRYYRDTQDDRDASTGGAHGDAAVRLLARYIGQRKAAPGFSNHSNGTAVDFTTTEASVVLGAETSQREAWRGSWLHAWLVAHAGEHSFHPLATEEWHWDYR